METVSIPLGMQCTVAKYLRDHKRRVKAYPFDWMLSHPKFVLTMLQKLLVDEIDPHRIVTNDFYIVDKKIKMIHEEHFRELKEYPAGMRHTFNSRYNVIFPHDNPNDPETVRKYTRRFQYLKDAVLNKDISIDFYYVSPSSTKSGNFTINGIEIVSKVFDTLIDINNLILKLHGSNFRLLIFDALQVESPMCFVNIPTIKFTLLNPENRYTEIIEQLNKLHV